MSVEGEANADALATDVSAAGLRLGIEHVGISVGNLDESVKWYVDNLGFRCVRRFENERQTAFAVLDNDGVELELIAKVVSTPHPGQGLPHGQASLTRGLHHLCFTVADCDAAYAELTAKGVTCEAPPRTIENDTMRVVWFFDVDGNQLELMQRLS